MSPVTFIVIAVVAVAGYVLMFALCKAAAAGDRQLEHARARTEAKLRWSWPANVDLDFDWDWPSRSSNRDPVRRCPPSGVRDHSFDDGET